MECRRVHFRSCVDGLLKGNTAFKPPDVEYRLTLAYNINHVDVPERRVLDVRPSRPSHRTDSFLGVQEAFIDKHLGNDSDRYDFHSIRIGIQPFQDRKSTRLNSSH